MTHCWLTNCWGSIRRLPAVVYPATCSSLVKSQQVNGETLTDQAGYFNFGLRFSNSKFQSLTGRACLTIAPECTRTWTLHMNVALESCTILGGRSWCPNYPLGKRLLRNWRIKSSRKTAKDWRKPKEWSLCAVANHNLQSNILPSRYVIAFQMREEENLNEFTASDTIST